MEAARRRHKAPLLPVGLSVGYTPGSLAAPILSPLPLLLPGLSAHLGLDSAGANPAPGTGCCCLCCPLSHAWLHQAPGWQLLNAAPEVPLSRMHAESHLEREGTDRIPISIWPGLCCTSHLNRAFRGIRAAENPPGFALAPGKAITSGFVTENIVKNKML